MHTDDHSHSRRCDICSKSFVSVQGLKRHKVVHDRTVANEFLCHKCGVKFSKKGSLDRHSKHKPAFTGNIANCD